MYVKDAMIKEMKGILTNCSKCGEQIERTNNIKIATCFKCKRKRQKELYMEKINIIKSNKK